MNRETWPRAISSGVLISFSTLLLASCARQSLPSDALFVAPSMAATRFVRVVSDKEVRTEVEEKLQRVRKFIRQRPLDALLLTRPEHVCWILAGTERIDAASSGDDHPKVLVTPTDVVVIASNIDAPRLKTEVTDKLGFKLETYRYFARSKEESPCLTRHCPDETRMATDAPDHGLSRKLTDEDLLWLFFPLTGTEQKKYRWLGHKCAEIVDGLASSLRPGMSELDVQYLIAREFSYWGIAPILNLTRVDERATQFKRPRPSSAPLESFVHIEVCAEKWGLHVRMNRQIHFGQPSSELIGSYRVSGRVLADMYAAAKVGAPFRDIVVANENAYASSGQAEEWTKDVQGGPILASSRVRPLRNLPESIVTLGMTLAFQPSFGGARLADTVLVGPTGVEVLTTSGGWPTTEFTVRGQVYRVPMLRVID